MPCQSDLSPGAAVGWARRVTLGILILVFSMDPRSARANGAFPESFQLLLAADRPGQIILATNFGLLLSDDDGATWSWTCEQEQIRDGSLFAVGAAPKSRFFSRSFQGLAYSDDDSCTWKIAGGSLAGLITTDFFPHPTDPMNVLAIGQPSDGAAAQRVFPSEDGGLTFKEALFDASSDDTITGIESARSDPRTIYIAMYAAPGVHPKLVRSTTGGPPWSTIALEAQLGPNNFRIIAIDPLDPKTITLRVIETLGESLAISRDGGDTFTKAFTLEGGKLTSYARLDNGTVLVGGIVLDKARGFRSTDGGLTFQDWQPTAITAGGPAVPHLSALGARGGKVYAAAKNYSDDWAVGMSTDDGLTFKPLTRYDQVKSVRSCVQATCLDTCLNLVARQVWEKAVCEPKPVPPPAAASSGCRCDVGGRGTPSIGTLALVVALVLTRRRRLC